MGERDGHVLRLAAGTAALLLSSTAWAEPPPPSAIVLPAITPAADCSACPPPHRPDPEAERDVAELARNLDSVLQEALRDLGIAVAPAAAPEPAEPATDDALVAHAAKSWVFAPRVGLEGALATIRIAAVAPGSTVVLSRTEHLRLDEVEVKAVLMMRDLVEARRAPGYLPAAAEPAAAPKVVAPARSRGRAVIALNAAVLGGYVGYALQRAGGSEDARLTYPLMALGTGIGLGASMIVAEEWDVGVGDAWYLSAGTWWPLAGTLFVAEAEDVAPSNKYILGAGSALGGIALATTSLSFGGMSEGGALVAHSGGAFGTLLGGITELAVLGRTDTTPLLGMGVGALSGVVVAGTAARFVPAEPSRILLVDLSAGLGGLTGAALGSPLVFGDEVTATQNRLWLTGIAVGTFAGAAVGMLVLPEPTGTKHDANGFRFAPYAGVVAESRAADGSSVAVPGGGLRGVF